MMFNRIPFRMRKRRKSNDAQDHRGSFFAEPFLRCSRRLCVLNENRSLYRVVCQGYGLLVLRNKRIWVRGSGILLLALNPSEPLQAVFYDLRGRHPLCIEPDVLIRLDHELATGSRLAPSDMIHPLVGLISMTQDVDGWRRLRVTARTFPTCSLTSLTLPVPLAPSLHRPIVPDLRPKPVGTQLERLSPRELNIPRLVSSFPLPS